MEYAKLETLTLHTVDKKNKNDFEFTKKMLFDESIKRWFTSIGNGLLNNPNYEFFNHSFLVKNNDEYIGIIGIGNYNSNEKCVYLRSAVDKDKRGKSYGKKILYEITEYIFSNYDNVESIRLKIDKENLASLATIDYCGYTLLESDYYIKYNPYIKTQKR